LTSLPTFAIKLAPVGEGSVRVQVEGELDLSTSPEFGDALRRELEGGRSVIVDLSSVTFIDSTALNTLVGALRTCESNGGRLAVSNRLPAQVSRVFEITGLDAVLPMASD
jgi:anti-anti-sigma factor